MKKIAIMLILFFAVNVSGQIDSVQVQAITEQNKVLEKKVDILKTIFLDYYLKTSGNEIDDAFIEQYLVNIELAAKNRQIAKAVQALVEDLKAIEDEKVKEVLTKHGLL